MKQLKILPFLRIAFDIESSRGNLREDFPSDFTEAEKLDIGLVKGQTMTSLERLVTLSRSIEYLQQRHIKGDIVECGVWKGGSMMLVAQKLLMAGDTDRRLFLFDTFEGMSSPGKEDVTALDKQPAQELLKKFERTDGENVWCYSSLDEVQLTLLKRTIPQKIYCL